MAIASTEILDCHRDGTVLLNIQHQRGQQVVVPDPHRLQNGSRNHRRLQDGAYDLEEDLQRITSVDHGGFLDGDGHTLDKAGEHEHRKTRAEAQIDDADVVRGYSALRYRRSSPA